MRLRGASASDALVLNKALSVFPNAAHEDASTKLKAHAGGGQQPNSIVRPFPPTPFAAHRRSRGASVLQKVLRLRGSDGANPQVVAAESREPQEDLSAPLRERHSIPPIGSAAEVRKASISASGPQASGSRGFGTKAERGAADLVNEARDWAKEEPNENCREVAEIAAPSQAPVEADRMVQRRRRSLSAALTLRRARCVQAVTPQAAKTQNREQDWNDVMVTSPPRPPERPPERRTFGFRKSAFRRASVNGGQAAVGEVAVGSNLETCREKGTERNAVGPQRSEENEAVECLESEESIPEWLEVSRRESEEKEAQRLEFVLNLSMEEAKQEQELESILNLSLAEQSQEQILMRKSIEEQSQEQVLLRMSLEEAQLPRSASSTFAPEAAHDISVSLEDSILDSDDVLRERAHLGKRPCTSSGGPEASETKAPDAALGMLTSIGTGSCSTPAGWRGEQTHPDRADTPTEDTDSLGEDCEHSALCQAVASQVVSGIIGNCTQRAATFQTSYASSPPGAQGNCTQRAATFQTSNASSPPKKSLLHGRCKTPQNRMRLRKLLLRYDPPGIGLQYICEDGSVGVRHKSLPPAQDVIFARDHICMLAESFIRSDGDLLRERHLNTLMTQLQNVYLHTQATGERAFVLDGDAARACSPAMSSAGSSRWCLRPSSARGSKSPNGSRHTRLLAQSSASPEAQDGNVPGIRPRAPPSEHRHRWPSKPYDVRRVHFSTEPAERH